MAEKLPEKVKEPENQDPDRELPTLSDKKALESLTSWLDENQYKLTLPYTKDYFGRSKDGIYTPKQCEACLAPLMIKPHLSLCATTGPHKDYEVQLVQVNQAGIKVVPEAFFPAKYICYRYKEL